MGSTVELLRLFRPLLHLLFRQRSADARARSLPISVAGHVFFVLVFESRRGRRPM